MQDVELKVSADSPDKVRLTGVLTVHVAAMIWPRMQAFSESGRDLAVDVSELGKVDLAGFQLLLMWQRHAASHGGRLSYSGVTEDLIQTLELIGQVAMIAEARS